MMKTFVLINYLLPSQMQGYEVKKYEQAFYSANILTEKQITFIHGQVSIPSYLVNLHPSSRSLLFYIKHTLPTTITWLYSIY
jgi:hypothetical protein